LDIDDILVGKILYRIPSDISRYGTKYRTSYHMKNIHMIASINYMQLFKTSLGS